MKYTFASCKGGVGKTTVTLNVGASLSKLGAKILIVDGDLATGAIGLKIGLGDVKVGLSDLLSGKETDVEKAIVESLGFHVLPSGFPSLRSFLKSKIENLPNVMDDIPKEYDIILIDSPPGINKSSVAVLKASDRVILVTTPEPPSISGALATKTTAGLLKKEVLGSVINRVVKPRFTLRGKSWLMKEKDVEAALGTKILGTIPDDVNVLKSLGVKKPVTIYKPKSSSAKSFVKIAKNILSK